MGRLRLLATFKRYTARGALYSIKNIVLLVAFVCANAGVLLSSLLHRRRRGSAHQRAVGILAMYRPLFWHGPIFEMHTYRWLEKRGYHPVFIICHGFADVCDSHFLLSNKATDPTVCLGCRLRHRAFFAKNNVRFVVLDEFADPGAPQTELQKIDRLQSLAEARAYCYQNLPLGELVLLSVSRYFLRTTLNQEHLDVYKQYLRAALKLHTAFSRLLRQTRFVNFLVFNGRYAMHGVPLRLIQDRHVPFTTYELGDAESFLISHDDISVLWNDVAERYRAWHGNGALSVERRRALEEVMDHRRRRYVATFTSVEANESTETCDVLCCTNVGWDSAAFGRDNTFASQFEWVTELISFCAARQLRLIVRIHPAETNVVYNKTRERMTEHIERSYPVLPKGVRVIPPDEPVSSYALLRQAKVLTVYSSTIGLEAAMEAKPVVVAGWAHYRGQGFTLDPCTRGEYFRDLERLLEGHIPTNVEAARCYAYWYYLIYNRLSNTQLFRRPFHVPEDSIMLRVPGIPGHTDSREFAEVMAEASGRAAVPACR